jgi:hypothetical protein
VPGLRCALLLGFLVGSASLPAAARSESAEAEVERLAADALNAYKGADYHRAVELLTKAYEIRQVPALLYNLAKAEDKLGDVERASDAYRRYAVSGGADPKLKARAEARLAVLDEARRKQAARAEAEAAAAATPPPQVAPQRPVVVEPPPVSAEQLAADERALRQRRRHRDRLFALGFGAATVAFAAVAVGLSVDALGLRNDYSASIDFEKKQQLESDALLRAGVADGFYAATVAAAVVTAVFLYRGFHHERAERLALAPSLSPSAWGLVASGRF